MAVDVHRCLRNTSGIYEIMGGEALAWRDFAGFWSMWDDDVRFDGGIASTPNDNMKYFHCSFRMSLARICETCRAGTE
jgi:hypothetical protein